MTAKEKALWEQAVRVLRQNSVTTKASAAGQMPPVGVRGRGASQRRRA
jgi:hypothetical protein